MVYLNNAATSWPKPPVLWKLYRRVLGARLLRSFGVELDHEKDVEVLCRKNWDSSLESGKQREYFLHQEQQKA